MSVRPPPLPLGMCAPAPALGPVSHDSTALDMQSISWSSCLLPTEGCLRRSFFLTYAWPQCLCLPLLAVFCHCMVCLPLLRQYSPMGCAFLSLSVQKSTFGNRHARPAGRKHWLSGTICAHGCSFPACSSGVASWLEMLGAMVVSHSTTIWGHELT